LIAIALFIGVAISIQVGEPHYFRTPFGLAWSECKYLIENGDLIKTDLEGRTTHIKSDGTMKHMEPCPYPVIRNRNNKQTNKRDSPNDGWQVWAAYNNANNVSFDAFLGNFNVPQQPSNWDGSALLYMFTGLQNDNWVPIPSEPDTPPGFDIIQPVLQYGGGPDGGGAYWSLASWYVTVDENVFYSNPMQVNAGDNIFGNMTRLNETAWFIGSLDTTSGQSTDVTVDDPRLNTQPWAYCTLEVYSVSDCAGDFPPSNSPLKFTNLKLIAGKQVVVPQWQTLDNGADHCGDSAAAPNAQSVTITF